jgi:clan AA aspartic protease (TIGR02281 family)
MSVAENSAARRSIDNWRRAAYFGLWGGGGGLAGALLCEFAGLGGQRAAFGELILKVGLWFGVIGALIAIAILLGSLTYSAGSLSAALNISNLPRLALGTALGGLSGFIAGAVAQGFYTGIGPTEVLRVICWGIAGGLLGLGLSFRIPNLTSMRGFAGGFAGGVVGGIVFIGISMVEGSLYGRLVGIPIIGFAIGLMIMLADALFRKAWIEIRYGPRETRTLTLGTEPLRIGSDAAHCQVYVKDVPAMACAYRFEQGRVVCDDRINNRNGPVAFGAPMAIGRITVTPFGTQAPDSLARSSPAAAPASASVAGGQQMVLSLKGGREFTLAEGVQLAATDIPGLEAEERNGWVAEVLRNPENRAVVGLKNLSRRRWSATFPSGRQVDIDPGRSLRLEDGAYINFGSIEGRIRSGGSGAAISVQQQRSQSLSKTTGSIFRKLSGSGVNWYSRRWVVLAGIGALIVVIFVAIIGRDYLPIRSADARTEEIKLESSGNTYQLKATINDTVKINFTLDTGASDVQVPAEVALTLLGSGTLSDSDFIGYQTYKLADGSTLPSAQFKLRDMEVGSHRLTNVVASVGPVGSPPLLGQSFLSRLGSWTIDNNRRVLLVQR